MTDQKSYFDVSTPWRSSWTLKSHRLVTPTDSSYSPPGTSGPELEISLVVSLTTTLVVTDAELWCTE